MAVSKSERLVNLTILLLSSRRFVTKEQIKNIVEGYRDLSDEAFNRAFERDKKELRDLSIPIQTGSNDPFFDGDNKEVGYRIEEQDLLLPPVEFDAEESAILSLASGVWQQANMAEKTNHAMLKLQAAGLEVSDDRPVLNVHLMPREQSFDDLWQATSQRRIVKFKYRHSDELRVVQPWHLALRSNSWYLYGYDENRADTRIFKLSRINGTVEVGKKPDAFEVPEFDREEVSRRIAQTSPDLTVYLAIRHGRAPALRRRGEKLDLDQLPEGFSAYRVRIPSRDAVAEVASFGSDVAVLAPADFRDAVVNHLSKVVKP